MSRPRTLKQCKFDDSHRETNERIQKTLRSHYSLYNLIHFTTGSITIFNFGHQTTECTIKNEADVSRRIFAREKKYKRFFQLIIIHNIYIVLLPAYIPTNYLASTRAKSKQHLPYALPLSYTHGSNSVDNIMKSFSKSDIATMNTQYWIGQSKLINSMNPCSS